MAQLNPFISTFSRSSQKLGSGGNEIFPTGLSAERYIIIKIYDTSEGDPNKALAKPLGGISNALESAFGSTLKAFGAADSGGVSAGFEEFGASIFNSFDGTFDGIKKYGETTLGVAKDSLAQVLDDFKDFGNPELNGSKEKWKDNIYLPLPNALNELMSHEYTPENGFIQSAPGISGPLAKAGELVSGASNLASKATGRQALIYNENKLNMFSGSAFREITLTWTLVPNNQQESRTIQTIITKLKAYSSPQAVAGKMLLRAPFFCRLEFPNKVLNDALQFKEVVIGSIEVDYSTSGNMETFITDNMPKTMTLTITFKDREPKTLQAWAEGEIGYGDKNNTPTKNTPPVTQTTNIVSKQTSKETLVMPQEETPTTDTPRIWPQATRKRF